MLLPPVCFENPSGVLPPTMFAGPSSGPQTRLLCLCLPSPSILPPPEHSGTSSRNERGLELNGSTILFRNLVEVLGVVGTSEDPGPFYSLRATVGPILGTPETLQEPTGPCRVDDPLSERLRLPNRPYGPVVTSHPRLPRCKVGNSWRGAETTSFVVGRTYVWSLAPVRVTGHLTVRS